MEAKFASSFVDDVLSKSESKAEEKGSADSKEVAAESKGEGSRERFESNDDVGRYRGRSDSVQVMAESNVIIIMPSIVNDVCDYFYEDDDLLEKIEDFLSDVRPEFEAFFTEKEDGGEPE